MSCFDFRSNCTILREEERGREGEREEEREGGREGWRGGEREGWREGGDSILYISITYPFTMKSNKPNMMLVCQIK